MEADRTLCYALSKIQNSLSPFGVRKSSRKKNPPASVISRAATSRSPTQIVFYKRAAGHIEVCAGYSQFTGAEFECLSEKRRLEQDFNSKANTS